MIMQKLDTSVSPEETSAALGTLDRPTSATMILMTDCWTSNEASEFSP